jgi:hypothetical protein
MTGFTGSQGIPGRIGFTGSQGEQGPQGPAGSGDLLVTADELGCATSAQTDDVPPTAVIGIALKDSELGYTEVKV